METKRKKAIEVISDGNRIAQSIVQDLETDPELINKFFRYSFNNDNTKRRATSKIDQMISNLNDNQKSKFNEIKKRIQAFKSNVLLLEEL